MSEVLPDATFRILRHYVRRYSPEWLRQEEEDLVQMAAMRVVRAGARMDHPHAYLKRTARTTVLDEMRRNRYRRETRFSTSISDRLANSRDLSPESVFRGHEVGEQIECALHALSADRQAVIGAYLKGASVSEIAARHGWKPKKVSNLMSRGMRDLRTQLARRDATP